MHVPPSMVAPDSVEWVPALAVLCAVGLVGVVMGPWMAETRRRARLMWRWRGDLWRLTGDAYASQATIASILASVESCVVAPPANDPPAVGTRRRRRRRRQRRRRGERVCE